MKNINDIEKKFIELTNNNSYLNNDQNIKEIKGDIRAAKDNVLLNDNNKAKIARTNRNDKLPNINTNRHPKILKDIQNIKILSADELVKKQQLNSEEMKHQKEEVEKMQKKLRELIGDNSGNNFSKVSRSEIIDNRIKNTNNESRSFRNENILNSRMVSIKTSKYYENGNIKK